MCAVYQMGRDMASLEDRVADLERELGEARGEAQAAVDQTEEHIWEVLKRLGICEYVDDPADDYVLGKAFKKK